MLDLARHRTTAVWLGLVVATLISWFLSEDHAFDSDTARGSATVAILLVAFVKVRFVGRDFMELRAAPPALRRSFDGWVAVVFVTLVVLYLAGG